MPQFNNQPLKQALAAMRADQATPNIRNVLDELIAGKVLAPATWDKDPVKNEQGQLVFEPNTKFSLMVLTNQDQELYFPMFSDMESLRQWNPDPSIQSLVLSWDQFLSFVDMARENVKGVVFNPATENIPMTAEFLLGAREAAKKSRLSANKLYKGETVYVRDPKENVADLKLGLETAASVIEEVKAIYLKERMESQDSQDSGHWFIIVDADEEDPALFEKIGHAIHPFDHGKAMEFMFASTALAQKITANSTPLYKK